VGGALEGIRVIDFGQYIAGPLAAMLLADQGADVIRVDPPGGPRWKTPANATWNRGKRSVVLDLKQPDDRAAAKQLIASADVVIENFRPGVMDRLGLGGDALCAADSGLIYCSLPGFAPDDPRAELEAWEGVIGAAASTYRRERTREVPGAPVYTAVPISSAYAAVQAAVAIAMALNVRERDGLGQRITVPIFDATFGAVGYNGLRVHNAQTAAAAGGGLGGQYLCEDGRWVYFHTGNARNRQVLEAAGVASWVDEGVLDRERMRDADFAADVRRRARELFLTRDAEDWEALITAAGGECAVCRESRDWMAHPAALESEMIVELDDPELGPTRQPGLAARLSLTPGAIDRPRPALDANRADVLADVRPRPTVPSRLPTDAELRAALDGVRVLDCCIVLAGPTCGRTLAEYGADVIKIEPPDRMPSQNFHLDVNRGKRSLVLDLKQPEGLEVFWKLVDTADVVTQNFRKGVADRLGIGYEQVKARKPDIVYASLNTYGQVGPMAERPGHEQIGQAATGLQARFGGDGQPQVQRWAVNDYGTGYFGAYAVALALLHRQRTGQGQHVSAALAYTGTTLQSSMMIEFEGKRWDEPRGQGAIGDGPLHRAYEAEDGWFFIGLHDADRERLAGVGSLDSAVAALEGAALADALAERFRTAGVDEWVARLNAAGVSAHRVLNDTRPLMEDPWVVSHGLSLTREHDWLGSVTTAGPAPRLSRTPVRPGSPAPRLGSHGRELLEEVGLSERADALIAQRVVITEGLRPGGAEA
jgi:crotonobetainyl-CoA:carnitine CoA-transferase CaiB-like acyl-CoA transferase